MADHTHDHHDIYNNLPPVLDAISLFEPHRAKVLSALYPIFSQDAYKGIYEVCLVHRHHELSQGEKMVSRMEDVLMDGEGKERVWITEPEIELGSRNTDLVVVPDRWFICHLAGLPQSELGSIGVPFEFTTAPRDKITPPPPEALWHQFTSVIQEVVGHLLFPLGICLASEKLDAGKIYHEVTEDDTRRHVMKVRDMEDLIDEYPPGHVATTTWCPNENHMGGKMSCKHLCTLTNGDATVRMLN
ncbi:hypothetical protein BDQ17DRAFT_311160 [Cyathus striatus]|nr:hypothetical protein BDQ17DRAFT_311160 [Cyathus striatus]